MNVPQIKQSEPLSHGRVGQDFTIPPLLKIKWALRRWTLKHLWYRFRLPIRRARWNRNDQRVLKPYLSRSSPIETEFGLQVAIGDFSGSHGLSRAAQYEVERIKDQTPDLCVIDTAQASLPQAIDRVCRDPRPIKTLYLLCSPDNYSKILVYFDPQDISAAHRIGLVVWENNQFPRRWRHSIMALDEIWTPSEFSAAAVRQGTDATIKIRPHQPIVDRTIPAFDRSMFDIPEDVFLGVAIMDIQSCPERKNPWAHVLAWQAAFGDDPKKLLLIKLKTRKKTRIVERELLEIIGTSKNIRVISEDFKPDTVQRFQRMADVYVSLHRAEGYGLNIREFLLLDIPVVATHWSANAEYGPESNNYFGVSFDLIDYQDWLNHYGPAEFQWADPNVEHAAQLLQHVHLLSTR